MPVPYDLIGDEYRELNRQLHAAGHYGQRGHRWGKTVAALLAEGGYISLLDYGCGTGELKKILGVEAMGEYDPAIEGKDLLPQPAELVICTDVLEHVEPERLANVIDHLAEVTRRELLVAISTRPAKKILTDGRNAHLIVESSTWWRERFERKFQVRKWAERRLEDGTVNEVVGLLSPIIKVGGVHGVSATPDDVRHEQIRVNVARVSARLFDLAPRRASGHVIACAYGPTLRATWETIEAERNAYINSVVATCSGAHDFLIERGVVPDYHVEVDPRIHKTVFTKNSHPDVHYLIASCCHPDLVGQLVDAGRRVTLFHVCGGQRDLDFINELEPETMLLAGGGSVGLRLLTLMYSLGYRSFSCRGLDNSYAAGTGEQHAGSHSGKIHHEIDVRVGDRWFKSSLIMIAYARYFFAEYKKLSQVSALRGEPPVNEHGEYVNLTILGDGMLAAMAEEILAGNVDPAEEIGAVLENPPEDAAARAIA